MRDVLIAAAARRVAIAALGAAHHGIVHAGLVKQLNQRDGGRLGARIEGAEAADVVEILGIRVGVQSWHMQAFGPVHARMRAEAPGVALGLEALEQDVELLGVASVLIQHEVPAHLDDRRDVVDHHRAVDIAGAAGGAGPKGLVGMALTDKQRQVFRQDGIAAARDAVVAAFLWRLVATW